MLPGFLKESMKCLEITILAENGSLAVAAFQNVITVSRVDSGGSGSPPRHLQGIRALPITGNARGKRCLRWPDQKWSVFERARAHPRIENDTSAGPSDIGDRQGGWQRPQGIDAAHGRF
jgi:hypothetical protein